MNARGTRRPHSRRPRPKPISRKPAGNKGCRKAAAVILLVFAAGLAAAADAVWWLIT